MRKSSAKCPNALQEFIDLANGVLAYHSSLKQMVSEYPIMAGYYPFIMGKKDVETQGIPNLYEYLYSGGKNDLYELRTTTLKCAVLTLFSLAKRERAIYSQNQSRQKDSLMLSYTEPNSFSINLRVDYFVQNYRIENGILKVIPNDFFALFEQHQIEPNRIRLCDNCDSIFWAVRSDSRACSKQCRDVLRQRRWREKDKEEYNRRRRRNYAYKKNKLK
ncbi:MAG: hypothetical protein M3209_11025 [Acidobacteriota bacterium]|nr:hypothetical protein [Acidobacteriota bacterium]